MRISEWKTIIKVLCALFVVFFNYRAYSIDTHTKVWLTTSLTGSLSDDKKFKYYLEPNLRFIDDKYKFNQTLLWLGIGYQLSPDILIFIGDTPNTIRHLSGDYSHRNTIWQQINWEILDTGCYQVGSRSRLLEIKDNHEAAWAIVFRERVLLKVPIQRWQGHALILSDEVFFHLKHTNWLKENTFISQNRALIGIGTQLSKHIASTVGYLNQYQFSNPNQMSHVLVMQLDINAD